LNSDFEFVSDFRFRILSFGAPPVAVLSVRYHPLLTQPHFGTTLPDMADAKKKKKPRRKAVMVGLGLDSDGHKRLTTGPNFVLMGGSQETHEVMTEKAIKINEKLAAAGKRLEEVSHEEFDDIAHSVGLPPGLPPAKPGNNEN
jgi:hypothetical protein